MSASKQSLDRCDAQLASSNQALALVYSTTKTTENAWFSVPFWTYKKPIPSGHETGNHQKNQSRSAIRDSYRCGEGPRLNFSEKPPADPQQCNICGQKANNTAVFYSCNQERDFINVCSYCKEKEIQEKRPGMSDYVTSTTTGTLLLSGKWVDVDLSSGR